MKNPMKNKILNTEEREIIKRIIEREKMLDDFKTLLFQFMVVGFFQLVLLGFSSFLFETIRGKFLSFVFFSSILPVLMFRDR